MVAYLLSVPLTQKFHAEGNSSMPADNFNVWMVNLLRDKHVGLMLDNETVHEIKTGLQFRKLLKLPSNFTFNLTEMVSFVQSLEAMQPFSQLK